MQHDAWFFVGIFAFIFLIWIATGGPSHPISFAGPTLSQPQELGGGTYLSFPRANFGFGNGTEVHLPGSSDGGGSVGGINGSSDTQNPIAVTGVAFGSPSPYRGKVSLYHYVSGAGSSDPNNESVTISVSQNAGTVVDITGWTLESETSGAASIIPKGTETPTSGIVNEVQDIVLTPGTSAYIASGRSPIGASFRENKCIGYFGQYQNFSPALPLNCPAPKDEMAAFYGNYYIRDDACVTYVNTLSRCQTLLSPPPGSSSACQAFLVDYLNYNGCMTTHKGDADFLGNTWRVYLGRSAPLFRSQHEVVKLLDKEGKTVDAFSY